MAGGAYLDNYSHDVWFIDSKALKRVWAHRTAQEGRRAPSETVQGRSRKPAKRRRLRTEPGFWVFLAGVVSEWERLRLRQRFD